MKLGERRFRIAVEAVRAYARHVGKSVNAAAPELERALAQARQTARGDQWRWRSQEAGLDITATTEADHGPGRALLVTHVSMRPLTRDRPATRRRRLRQRERRESLTSSGRAAPLTQETPQGVSQRDVTSARPEVRLFLDLSTRHLPRRFFDPGAYLDLVGAHPTDVGMILWVPDDPEPEAAASTYRGDRAPEILRVRTFARALGCDYIMFDRDGPEVAELPTWSW